MQIEPPIAETKLVEKPARPEPGGFVMSVALVLFVLTIGAVLTMHYAARFNWQMM
jgi:hypothetical protein